MSDAPFPLPPRLVTVIGYKQIADVGTGELLSTKAHRSILVDDVFAVPQRLFPKASFDLTVKRDGTLVSAIGPVAARRLDTSYPGARTYGDVLEAEHAMRGAGLTRGFSPAGRALDAAVREDPRIRQWRVKDEFMGAFQGALYGGVQFGGNVKPDLTAPPLEPGYGWYQADIASSYPYLATLPLPTVASCFFERGARARATLWRITAEQVRPVLWRRGAYGEPYQDDSLTGWYVAEEIAFLEAHGLVRGLDVELSLTFGQTDRYLAPLIDRLYPLKEAETFPPRRLALKTAMNGLIGRFAFRTSPWRAMRDDEPPAGRTRLEIGSNVLVFDAEQAQHYPRTSNVIWTTLTNARARVRLWEKVLEIERAGGVVLWAHTDAVIALVPDSYSPRESGAALGQWRTLTRTYTQGYDHAAA